MVRMLFASPILAVLGALSCLGCGSSDTRVERFEISGTVTYNGIPLPSGFITFIPDTTRGNSGPGGGAVIQDGQYCTRPGQGIVGGPYLVKIVGYDGLPAVSEEGEELPEGTTLFLPCNFEVDLPREAQTRDFAVPDNLAPRRATN